jgi:hypothetical protein
MQSAAVRLEELLDLRCTAAAGGLAAVSDE